VATEPAEDEVVDSPTGWVARHIERYVASDGAKGHEFHGAPSLLLTTRGRRSGKLRRTALYYGRYPDDLGATVDADADPAGGRREQRRGSFVVVASNGGARAHPLWYENLVADPRVHVQVGPDHVDGRARVATGEERSRLWALMTGVYRTYDAYQQKTRREIPVVVIDVDA
jgi:deazaflavin-dependent oxidoreductase (nitroreductase family)